MVRKGFPHPPHTLATRNQNHLSVIFLTWSLYRKKMLHQHPDATVPSTDGTIIYKSLCI